MLDERDSKRFIGGDNRTNVCAAAGLAHEGEACGAHTVFDHYARACRRNRADHLVPRGAESCCVQIAKRREILWRNGSQSYAAGRRRGRLRRGDALPLLNAAHFAEAALLIELQTGFRGDQLQSARPRLVDDQVHQPPADALSLLLPIDHDEPNAAEGFAVGPPRRSAEQRAIFFIANDPAASQAIVETPSPPGGATTAPPA